MARYEPRRCPRLETNRVYDTKEERFITSDEVSDILNAHAGMMTREQVESLRDEANTQIYKTQTSEGYFLARGEFHAYKTVLNGGTK